MEYVREEVESDRFLIPPFLCYIIRLFSPLFEGKSMRNNLYIL
jgi:hypothetical protein